MINLCLFVISFILIWKSADYFVDASHTIACYSKLPPILIGATIVAFGTSAPELFVNMFAAYAEQPNIVYGNIFGSNIANSCLIFGVACCLTRLHISSQFKRYMLLNILALGATIPWLIFNLESRISAIIILGLFVCINVYAFANTKTEETTKPKTSLLVAILIFGISLIILMGSSRMLISSLLTISQLFGISSTFLSVVAVALGTSLPELVSSIAFIKKGHSDMVIGNILGSNIFNLLFVLPISWLVLPSTMPILFFKELIFLAILGLSLYVISIKKTALFRVTGSVSLVIYITYIGYAVQKLL
jgi:cation:H+ antiporter